MDRVNYNHRHSMEKYYKLITGIKPSEVKEPYHEEEKMRKSFQKLESMRKAMEWDCMMYSRLGSKDCT